ncbi:MAG: hypothetical protein ACOC80_15830 [Petrotogales bacterium]
MGKKINLLKKSYILGLWCADGYHRTSSVGLTNCNVKLVLKFYKFFENLYSKSRIKMRIYLPKTKNPDLRIVKIVNNNYNECLNFKGNVVAYQVYVNDRKLLNQFKRSRNNRLELKKEKILQYMCGRFDGDGSINNNLRSEMRIVYGSLEEAQIDRQLFTKLKLDTRLYHYKTANTYCVYYTVDSTKKIVKDMKQYSTKIFDKFTLRDL